MKKVKILGICGSIRKNSSSHAVLHAVAEKLPSEIIFRMYEGLAAIPAFDGREDEPLMVIDFKNEIKQSDGVIICTPEYAFGVPGALKNALDWTVGTGEFVAKPVALITASSQGERGHESLQHTLHAISAKLQPEATLLISFVRSKVKDNYLTDEATQRQIEALATYFAKSLK